MPLKERTLFLKGVDLKTKEKHRQISKSPSRSVLHVFWPRPCHGEQWCNNKPVTWFPWNPSENRDPYFMAYEIIPYITRVAIHFPFLLMQPNPPGLVKFTLKTRHLLAQSVDALRWWRPLPRLFTSPTFASTKGCCDWTRNVQRSPNLIRSGGSG